MLEAGPRRAVDDERLGYVDIDVLLLLPGSPEAKLFRPIDSESFGGRLNCQCAKNYLGQLSRQDIQYIRCDRPSLQASASSSLIMRLCAQILLPIAALLYASLCHAIFADEAYQTDSHHALLGLPQAHTTFFHRPSAASKASLLYTLSERLVLGAINPKDGAVIWRQRLADPAVNYTTRGLLRAVEGGDTLVSAVDGKVQAWDAADGRLAWEWDGGNRAKVVDVSLSAESGKHVLVLSEGEGSGFVVNNLAAETGERLWESSDTRYAEPQQVGFRYGRS